MDGACFLAPSPFSPSLQRPGEGFLLEFLEILVFVLMARLARVGEVRVLNGVYGQQGHEYMAVNVP